MIYKIYDDRIVSGDCIISKDALKLFIGRDINLKIRHFKNISISRERGHVKIYDTEFIIGAKYKYKSDGLIYTCVDIDSDSNAIMRAEHDCLEIIYDHDVNMWEVM